MNKKLGKLTVEKSADYYNKVVKALEDAGFVLVFDLETTSEAYYIVAESEENNPIKIITNAKEAEEYQISKDISKSFEEFTKIMFKQGQEESEVKK